MVELSCDVAVVGCGIAGLSAAVQAAESGAHVIILERAPITERGGNTRWTEALLRVTPEGDPLPDFADGYANSPGFHILPEFVSATASDYDSWTDLVKSAPFADPDVLDMFLSGVRPGIDWLKDHGVRTQDTIFPLVPPVPALTGIYGGGLALVDALCPAFEALGGKIVYETTATDLVRDDQGKVIGLCAEQGGERIEIRANAVVLASGGFEGNKEMMARYLGPSSKFLRPIARGGWYNKGEGIRMALDAGAAGAGDYTDCHREPVDPRSNMPEALVNAFPLGIVVNQNGERFMDEASSDPSFFQEGPCIAVSEQPGGVGYFIYDSRIDEVTGWRAAIRSDQPPIEADKLEELADKIGIPASALLETVHAFNLGCVDDPLDATTFDGRATHGVKPAKSNFARPLTTGPFGCYPMISGIVFTYGALKVNRNAQVIASSGNPIPGLYAAGETVGLIYGVYVAATSVLRGLVFGRAAGAHAASVAATRNDHPARIAFEEEVNS